MPVLGKHELTRYLGTECPKQLRLMLSTPAEQAAQGMPPKQPPRPGLQQIAAAGDEWAAEKLAELDTALPATVLLGARQAPQPGGGVAFNPTPLTDAGLRAAAPGTFLAEYEFEIGPTFEAAYGIAPLKGTHGLTFSRLRPDLIEVRAPATSDFEESLPDGRVSVVRGGDGRIRLRVIDIKLTSQPGPGYLAEVVYYSVALAGWLSDKGLSNDFAVEADPAIWPGSHTASAITEARNAATAAGLTLSVPEFLAALEAELVVFPYEVFAARLRHFFTAELPDVLAAAPWQSLPFSVGTKCRGCDFLGQNWGPSNPGHPDHCLPTATATDHLSRIPFVSRGALDLLARNGAPTVGQVAGLPAADPVFNKHHTLRGQRTVLAGRAAALGPGGTAGIPNRAGTSATIPSWSDLRVYVSADFDTSSALTLVFGVKAWWREPSVYGTPAPAGGYATKSWQARPFLVDNRSLAAEEQQLMQFLAAIDQIVRDVKAEDARLGTSSTAQFYVWDDLTYRHLTRVAGRHLQAILNHPSGMRYLAWLFPPEEVLGTAKLVLEPAVSVVSNAVKNLLALPVPHHYSLLGTARGYHRASVQPPWDEFRVPSLFEDPFSDQIPSERAHAIWTKAGGRYPWGAQAADLDRTIKVRLNALEEITAKLGEDLRGQLMRKAPPVTSLAPPAGVNRLTPDELLILAYHRLNDAFQQNKTAQVRAMPPHQREARFACARLTRRLDGADRTTALATLGVTAGPDELVYEIRPGSEDAKFEEGAFRVAVIPEDRTEILDWRVRRLVGRAAAGGYGPTANHKVADVLGVEVVKFDRVNRLALLRWNNYHSLTRQALLAAGLLAMDRNLSLEPAPHDFLGPRLETTLQAIGRTPKAVAPPAAAAALGIVPRRGPNPMPRVPVEDVLWDALAMSREPVHRPGLAAARIALEQANHGLNQWQWDAWEHALTRRLSLLWGPPGTGKSRTLKNVIVGAALDAQARGIPLRILVSASTWSAVDNVLLPVTTALAALVPSAVVYRLQVDDPVPGAQNVAGERGLTPATQPLANRLTTANADITIVGSSSQQLNKFAVAAGSPTTPLFDLIVCDEASQTDVANAVLPLATLAEDGSVVVAGDPLQLPPIRQVDAPVGTEALVGSLYGFLADHHHVQCQALEVNYRSNKEIVAIAHQAKYRPGLHAFSPDLRLNLLTPLPNGPTPPAGWPANLPWSDALPELLDPSEPVVCLVHPDALSGQSSDFEAQIVAGLAWLLNGHTANGLTDEIDAATNALRPASAVPYTPAELFHDGIGVVSPHRAQISKIVSLLAAAGTGATAKEIRDAVDSVERYQGQQRDVIIASYAVGDPDTIADEDEFLQSLNRFNVMASRARAKLVVILSESLVQHLPSDLDVLRGSALLKSFAETACANRTVIDLNWHDPSLPAGTVSTVRVSKRVP